MPNLGPEYDLAKRIDRLEQALGTVLQNLGQAFSTTQSDGTVGMQIGTNPAGNGATAMVFFQGPTTPRDSQTGLHPAMAYFGELYAGGVSVDSGVIFYRPDGSQSMIIGKAGVQIYDQHGNTMIGTDETSGLGLSHPYLPLPLPQSNVNTNWPNTAATSWSAIAISNTYVQHPRIRWQASVYCPAGVTGQVQLMTTGGVALSSVWTGAAGGFTNIDETFAFPGFTPGQTAQLYVNAQVTSGTGNIYCQTYGMYGVAS